MPIYIASAEFSDYWEWTLSVGVGLFVKLSKHADSWRPLIQHYERFPGAGDTREVAVEGLPQERKRYPWLVLFAAVPSVVAAGCLAYFAFSPTATSIGLGPTFGVICIALAAGPAWMLVKAFAWEKPAAKSLCTLTMLVSVFWVFIYFITAQLLLNNLGKHDYTSEAQIMLVVIAVAAVSTLFLFAVALRERQRARYFAAQAKWGQIWRIPRWNGSPGGRLGEAERKFGPERVTKGQIGEHETSGELATLFTKYPGMFVLHSVQWPGSQNADIDHVVIAGQTIIVIDTKYWQDGQAYNFAPGMAYRNGQGFPGGQIRIGEAVESTAQAVRGEDVNPHVTGLLSINSQGSTISGTPAPNTYVSLTDDLATQLSIWLSSTTYSSNPEGNYIHLPTLLAAFQVFKPSGEWWDGGMVEAIGLMRDELKKDD